MKALSPGLRSNKIELFYSLTNIKGWFRKSSTDKLLVNVRDNFEKSLIKLSSLFYKVFSKIIIQSSTLSGLVLNLDDNINLLFLIL